jgi:hypothetical protein
VAVAKNRLDATYPYRARCTPGLCARNPNIWRRERPIEAQAAVMQRWVRERTSILFHGSTPPIVATDPAAIN